MGDMIIWLKHCQDRTINGVPLIAADVELWHLITLSCDHSMKNAFLVPETALIYFQVRHK